MSSNDNSHNTPDDISQPSPPGYLPSSHSNGTHGQYLPGYLFDHTNPSQSIGNFSNFSPPQVQPSSSVGCDNIFEGTDISCADELQVRSFEETLGSPSSGHSVHADYMQVVNSPFWSYIRASHASQDPNIFTRPLSLYQARFPYVLRPTPPSLVTSTGSDPFNTVVSHHSGNTRCCS